MDLQALCDKYAHERDIEDETAKWIGFCARRYSRHLGRSATTADLTDDSLNAWVAAMLKENLTRRTARGYRGALIMLWRFGVELNLIGDLPRRLRRIKVEKIIPAAWSEDEVGRLLTQAVAMGGRYRCGVPRSTFWLAVVLAIWDSGLRIGDLLRLRRDQIAADGKVCIVQRKTSWPHAFTFKPRTLALISEISAAHSGPCVFGGVISRKWVFVTFKKIVTNAGLNGGTKKIRKSGATAVERVSPGAAMGYLGHQTPSMAYMYYVDPRLTQVEKPAPPPLAERAAE